MKPFSRYLLKGVGVGLLLSAASGGAYAQQITPSHVYQLVDYTYEELAAFHAADFSAPPEVTIELAPRKPRHVLQKAQEVYIKVQKLRMLNGLEEEPVIPIPVRAVKPADVKASVQVSVDALKPLREIYGIEETFSPPLPEGKKPTDVYRHLVQVSASLNHLGLPEVVPNDVYRVAETIVLDLKQVLKHKGLSSNIPLKPVKGKKPPHVYEQTVVLLKKLQLLTKRPEYAIAGGVVLPPQPKEKIKPLHVMNGLGDAMAEIGAIKFKVGMSTPTKFAPARGGKTPSDVFAVVKQAQALVDKLLQKQSSAAVAQKAAPVIAKTVSAPVSVPSTPAVQPQLQPVVQPKQVVQPVLPEPATPITANSEL